MIAGDGSAERAEPMGTGLSQQQPPHLVEPEAGPLLRPFVRREEIKHLQDS